MSQATEKTSGRPRLMMIRLMLRSRQNLIQRIPSITRLTPFWSSITLATIAFLFLLDDRKVCLCICELKYMATASNGRLVAAMSNDTRVVEWVVKIWIIRCSDWIDRSWDMYSSWRNVFSYFCLFSCVYKSASPPYLSPQESSDSRSTLCFSFIVASIFNYLLLRKNI